MAKKKVHLVSLWLLLFAFGLSAFVYSMLPQKINNIADQSIFSEEMVCKAGISTVLGRNSEGISVYTRTEDGYLLSYVRESDKREFIYKCKVEGERVVWGNFDGRWRDSSSDSKVTYIVDDGILTVKEVYSDGSVNADSFLPKDLE